MTDEEKIKVANLRARGFGYTAISKELNISANTIKAYCKRSGLGGVASEEVDEVDIPIIKCRCQNCGKKIAFPEGRKEKKFCSDKCRVAWWNTHPEKVNRKAVYEFTCAHCGKPFTAYGNAGRKYCCHACYIADRFKGGDGNE